MTPNNQSTWNRRDWLTSLGSVAAANAAVTQSLVAASVGGLPARGAEGTGLGAPLAPRVRKIRCARFAFVVIAMG